MSLSFTLSPELVEYGRVLREWSATEARPYAREADDAHDLPAGWQKILDTCPVPIGRTDPPNVAPIPTFRDGYRVTQLVYSENLNYGDNWVSVSMGNGIGHVVVKAVGTPEQVQKWYTRVIELGQSTGFALTEPQTGSDTSQLASTATRDGDTWVINGSKMYCSMGARADYITVFASTDRSAGPSAIAAFVVPRGTPGFTVTKENESKLGMRSSMTSELRFENCVIPLDNRLGWTAEGPAEDAPGVGGLGGALSALSDNRPNMSAWAIGTAQASIDVTKEILHERRHGFTPQRWALIENDFERMSWILERGRLLNFNAQYRVDQGAASRFHSAASKTFAPQTCDRIVLRCMQLLGPEGTSKDLLLEKWYRDIKIVDIFEGTGQIQRLLVARHLMGRVAG